MNNMKSILLILILALSACTSETGTNKVPPAPYKFNRIYDVVGTIHYVYEYNGCYYFGTTGLEDLTHLGNCPNPIHIYNNQPIENYVPAEHQSYNDSLQ